MTTVDLGALLLSSVFILASAYMFRKKQLDRLEGIILVLMEAGYMWYLIANL
jgi:cation:H+ antiporter